jgi:hypothetical protein
MYGAGLLPFLLQADPRNDADDHRRWHMPTVESIAVRFPGMDLHKDPKSATAPGYHYLLAGLMKAGARETVLRGVHAGICLMVILFLGAWAARVLPWKDVLVLLSPLAWSPYFLKASAWIVTDNVALLGMTAALILMVSPAGRVRCGWLGLMVTATVWVRQNTLWLVFPGAVALGREWGKTGVWRWMGKFLLLTLGPLLSVGWMAWEWGGLVPPVWREANQGLSPVSLVHALALAACILGPGALFLIASGLLRMENKKIWVITGLLGLAWASTFTSTPDMGEGRWGGVLWKVAERVPDTAGRSWVFLLLTPCGVMAMVVWAEALIRHTGALGGVWVSAIGVWMLAMGTNPQAFHRYVEPPLWIFMIFGLVLLIQKNGLPRFWAHGRALFAAMAGLQACGLIWLWMRA